MMEIRGSNQISHYSHDWDELSSYDFDEYSSGRDAQGHQNSWSVLAPWFTDLTSMVPEKSACVVIMKSVLQLLLLRDKSASDTCRDFNLYFKPFVASQRCIRFVW